jgi:hypothetical protein
MTSRRAFAKSAGFLALAASSGLTMVGCDPLGSYLQAGLAAFSSLIALLEKNGVLSATNPLVAAVLAAFSAAMAADNAYQKDKAAGSSTISADLDAINAALQNFVANAPIPSGLVTVVLDAIEVILSTIAGWVGTLSPTVTIKGTLTAKSGATVQVVAKKRSKHAFISDWNSTVTKNGHPELSQHNSWF